MLPHPAPPVVGEVGGRGEHLDLLGGHRVVEGREGPPLLGQPGVHVDPLPAALDEDVADEAAVGVEDLVGAVDPGAHPAGERLGVPAGRQQAVGEGPGGALGQVLPVLLVDREVELVLLVGLDGALQVRR